MAIEERSATVSAVRILIYSHDGLGLEQLRRCQAIAHYLVARYRQLSVLILSGSPLIASLDFNAGVDFVRVPSVVSLGDGKYTSLSLNLDIKQMIALRSSIIQHTADIFDPHLFLVDKESLGLLGEVSETLNMLKARSTRLVLSLLGLMDEPAVLLTACQRKDALPALDQFYDEIWIDDMPDASNPFTDLPGMGHLAGKVRFIGLPTHEVRELASREVSGSRLETRHVERSNQLIHQTLEALASFRP